MTATLPERRPTPAVDQHSDLFAAARELLAVRDGDGRIRAERLLASQRAGCACSHDTEPCRPCRTAIGLATETLASLAIPAPRKPAGIETVAVVRAPVTGTRTKAVAS